MRNATIIFITPTDRILLVKLRKDHKWTTPGGMIDRTDPSPWYAACREFREEVGVRLRNSKIKNKREYNYQNHTMIYIIHSTQKIRNFIPNNEIIDITFMRISKLIGMLNDPIQVNLIKYCAVRSFNELISNNLLKPVKRTKQNNPFNQTSLINPFNQTNPVNPFNQTNPLNLFNQNIPIFQLNTQSNIKTLVYVGEKPDSSIPFGGYHITIARKNDIPFAQMINIVKNSINVFNKYSGYYGWILRSNTTHLKVDNKGNHYIRIYSNTFNKFAYYLKQNGVKRLRSNWHINLNTNDIYYASILYNNWTSMRTVFNIYVIEYDTIMNTIRWNLII
jgi:8-oxo-dGTP pyrophosphatase MutT (NUDIX family)